MMSRGLRIKTTMRVYDYQLRHTVLRERMGTVRAVEGDALALEVLVTFDDLVQTCPSGLITETTQSAWLPMSKCEVIR